MKKFSEFIVEKYNKKTQDIINSYNKRKKEGKTLDNLGNSMADWEIKNKLTYGDNWKWKPGNSINSSTGDTGKESDRNNRKYNR